MQTTVMRSDDESQLYYVSCAVFRINPTLFCTNCKTVKLAEVRYFHRCWSMYPLAHIDNSKIALG